MSLRWQAYLPVLLALAGAVPTVHAEQRIEEPASAYGQYTKNNPFPLRHGEHLMVEWRMISPGRATWSKPTGVEPGFSDQDAAGVRLEHSRQPAGIRLEAQRAEKIGPVLKIDKPWERIIAGGWVIKDQGKYKMWYNAHVPENLRPLKDTNWPHMVTCYAESEDGLTWVKPDLGLFSVGEHKNTNIVPEMPATEVFVDPQAPPAQRYKVMHPNPKGGADGKALYISSSADLIHWTTNPQPACRAEDDGMYAVTYDETLKKYVVYVRTYVNDRRTVGRSETADPLHWPPVETVMWPEPEQPPWIDYYLSNYMRYPGTTDGHLMLQTIYDHRSDRSYLRLAVSPDNKRWCWAPGVALEPGPIGSWDGGCLFAHGNFIELPGDRVAVPYAGYELPHKFPRYKPLGAIGLAAWKRGRLSALIAEQQGEFTTVDLEIRGRKLFLNAQTDLAGEIRLALVKEGNTPLAGFSLEDSDPIRGDQLKAPVTWKGKVELPAIEGGVAIHCRMRQAKIFALEVQP